MTHGHPSTLRVPSASARTAYHGFPIVVRERDLTILDPSGRRLFEGRMELSSARRFIRSYKRGSLSERQAAAFPASRSLNDSSTELAGAGLAQPPVRSDTRGLGGDESDVSSRPAPASSGDTKQRPSRSTSQSRSETGAGTKGA